MANGFGTRIVFAIQLRRAGGLQQDEFRSIARRHRRPGLAASPSRRDAGRGRRTESIRAAFAAAVSAEGDFRSARTVAPR